MGIFKWRYCVAGLGTRRRIGPDILRSTINHRVYFYPSAACQPQDRGVGGRQKKLLQFWSFPNMCGYLLFSDPISEKEIIQNNPACPEPPALALRPQERVQETL